MRVLGAVCAVTVAVSAGPSVARSAPPPDPPLGTVSSILETRTVVARLDPETLRPTGPQVELGEYHDGWAFSPDGRRVAFGKSPAGSNTRDGIRIVDVARVELLGTVLTPAFVGPLGWLAGNRLVGLVADTQPVVVDPGVPRIVGPRRRRAAGTCLTPPRAATRRALVVLSRGALATVDARGRVRRVRVPIVPSSCFRAALVVPPRSERAWVIAGRRGVARVDLRAMRAVPLSLRGRGIGGGSRLRAHGVDRRRIAVAHSTGRGAGRGVEVLDLRARRRSTLHRRAGGVAVAAGTVLAFDGGSVYSRTRTPSGVVGYTPGGRRRFAVLRGARVWNVQVTGAYAYAIGTNGVSLIDVRAGRVVGTAPAIRDADVELLAPPRR